MKTTVAILFLCLLILNGCATHMHGVWTTKDTWYTGFPVTGIKQEENDNFIPRQRLVPVAAAHIAAAAALLQDISFLKLDLARAQELTALPDLSPDLLLKQIVEEATMQAEKREGEAGDPFFADHAARFRKEAAAQRRLAERATALMGKLDAYLVRAVVLQEGTGAFAAAWHGSALLIHHGCLGHSPVPMQRHPLVVFLEKAPAAVYTDVSMDE